jgi:hypothetical protein
MGCDPQLAQEEQAATSAVTLPEDALGSDTIEQTNEACYKETFHQPDVVRTNKLDLLLVIDTSASLLAERGLVANRIDKFLKHLPAGAQYRIAVMLAHGKRSPWAGKIFYKGFLAPAVFDSKGRSSQWMRINLWLRMVLTPMDYWADGGEASFYSLNKALEPDSLAKIQKLGFLRPDAALSVVFISDENELCYEYPSDVAPRQDFDMNHGRSLESIAREENCTVKDANGNSHWLNASYMLQRLKALKGEQPLTITAIVHTKKTLQNLQSRSEDEYGYGYLDLVAQSGGVAIDIREKNYTAGLERAGQNTSTSMTLFQKFALTHTDIDVASLAVDVDTAPRTDFSWLASEGSVFMEHPGTANSTIEINYCRASSSGGGGSTDPGSGGTDPGSGSDPGTDPGSGGTDPGSGTDPGTEDPGSEDPGTGTDPGDDGSNPDGGSTPTEPGDGGDLPGGCTASDCPDVGL